jgi:hypothetical protein
MIDAEGNLISFSLAILIKVTKALLSQTSSNPILQKDKEIFLSLVRLV